MWYAACSGWLYSKCKEEKELKSAAKHNRDCSLEMPISLTSASKTAASSDMMYAFWPVPTLHSSFHTERKLMSKATRLTSKDIEMNASRWLAAEADICNYR